MERIIKVKNQKSKIKNTAILLLILLGLVFATDNVQYEGLMPEVSITAPRYGDEIAMMPEVLVTAPSYDAQENMMPEVVITAQKPEVLSQEVAMLAEAAAQYPDYPNSYYAYADKLIGYELGDEVTLEEKVKDALMSVQIRTEKSKKVKGKLIIESADTVSEDINFSGSEARIDGLLDGDFSIKGGTVDVSGMIDGDVSVIAGTMNVFGLVKGDVAVLGGEILNKGTINGDVLVAGGDIKLDSGSVVTGDIAIIGGTIAQDTNAIVKGEIKSVSSKLLNKAFPKFPAMVRFSSKLPESLTFTASALVTLLVIIGIFIITLLVILIFPKPSVKVAGTAHKNVWIPIAIGFGIQLLVVPLIVLLAVSIIGIMVIPVFILALFACLVLGFTSVFYLIGTRIKPSDEGKGSTIAKFAIGFIVIMAIPLLGAIIRIVSPVGGVFTAIGSIIIYVVATIGLGAAFYTLVTRKKQ